MDMWFANYTDSELVQSLMMAAHDAEVGLDFEGNIERPRSEIHRRVDVNAGWEMRLAY